MRLHRSERLQAQWYNLPTEIRAFIESLKKNPRPSDALAFPEHPNYYEELVGGVWIGWQVDESGSETIISVAIADQFDSLQASDLNTDPQLTISPQTHPTAIG